MADLTSLTHPLFAQYGEWPGLPMARGFQMADAVAHLPNWRPYDVSIPIRPLLANGSRDVTVSLPSNPAFLVRMSAISDSLDGFETLAIDSVGNALSSLGRVSGLMGVPTLPAPLGFAQYSPLTRPRIIPGWLRLQIRSQSLIDQNVNILLSFVIPESGEGWPQWVSAQLDLAKRAIHDPSEAVISVQGSSLPTILRAAPARAVFLAAVAGDGVLFPALPDRSVSIVALDLYTENASDFALYAGTPGGGSNRLLVARKNQFVGPLVYQESAGVSHFDLAPGESLLLNQVGAPATWSGAVKFRIL